MPSVYVFIRMGGRTLLHGEEPHSERVRKMRRTVLFLAVIALVIAVDPPAPATTGTMVITTDTTLTEDHDAGSVDVGIEFAADDVTLDCAGYTVSGGGIGSGILIEGHTGVTVKNCLVTAFSSGIVIGGSSKTLRANYE
jgi:hypothetical protein